LFLRRKQTTTHDDFAVGYACMNKSQFCDNLLTGSTLKLAILDGRNQARDAPGSRAKS